MNRIVQKIIEQDRDIEGTYDLDGNVNYLIEVPFKTIREAALESLTKNARAEGDPDDEIKKATNKSYVTLLLEGDKASGIKVKLGKGKEWRKKMREDRKNAKEAAKNDR